MSLEAAVKLQLEVLALMMGAGGARSLEMLGQLRGWQLEQQARVLSETLQVVEEAGEVVLAAWEIHLGEEEEAPQKGEVVEVRAELERRTLAEGEEEELVLTAQMAATTWTRASAMSGEEAASSLSEEAEALILPESSSSSSILREAASEVGQESREQPLSGASAPQRSAVSGRIL